MATEGRWLTRGVASVGAASFGSDAGHEMTTSLLPSFLTSDLHAGPAALGAIEGVSDALVGLSRLAGGPLSADPARRGRLASGGYLVTAFATAAFGWCSPWATSAPPWLPACCGALVSPTVAFGYAAAWMVAAVAATTVVRNRFGPDK